VKFLAKMISRRQKKPREADADFSFDEQDIELETEIDLELDKTMVKKPRGFLQSYKN